MVSRVMSRFNKKIVSSMTPIRTFVSFILLLCMLLFASGCAGTKSLGQVGNTKYYTVRARSIFNPSVTLIVSQSGDSEPRVETAAAGQGVGQTFITAAGNVGSAAAFGLSLRPDRTQVNNASGSDSASSSASASTGTGTTSVTGGSYTRTNGNSANAPGHNK